MTIYKNITILFISIVWLIFLNTSTAFSQTDEQFEIGIKGVPKTMFFPILSSANGEVFANVEIFGRIPVKSLFSVNIATGFELREYKGSNDYAFEGQRGTFIKLGLNKAFGEKRTHFILGLNYILSYARNISPQSFQDDEGLWEPAVFELDERKFRSAVELELGYETHLGKNLYLGSSVVFNTGFNGESEQLDNFNFLTMPGISGVFGQEYMKLHFVNFSYKF